MRATEGGDAYVPPIGMYAGFLGCDAETAYESRKDRVRIAYGGTRDVRWDVRWEKNFWEKKDAEF